MTAKTISKMKGVKKAAVLLVSLSSDVSAQVLRCVNERDLERLTLEVFRLERVNEDTKGEVMEECYSMALAKNFVSSGGSEYAHQLLGKAIGPEKANEFIGKLLAFNRPSPFDFLKRMAPQTLLNFIQGEHPQMIALVLSHLPASLTARLIAGLSEEMQGDVAMRVALMDPTTPEIIDNIEKVLQHKLSTVMDQEYTTVGGTSFLAKVLSNTERGTEKAILKQLDEVNADLAAEVRKLMFVFEDLIGLDDRSMQRLLRDVDTKDLALALKTANDDLKGLIFKNLSSRAAEMLREEIDLTGPAKVRSIEEAQQRIVTTARRLEDAEEIVISREKDDEIA